MPLNQDEGVVLRVRSYREDDLLVTIFFRKQGKVSGVARAGKKSRRRFGGLLMPLHQLSVQYQEYAHSSLVGLREASMVQSFLGAHRSLERLMQGTYLIDLVLHFTEERQPNESLYQHLLHSLERLSGGDDVELVVRKFEWLCLTAVGYRPLLSNCVICRRSRPENLGALFYPSHGGIICRECPSADEGIFLSPDAIQFLLNESGAANQKVKDELRKFLPVFITYQLGRSLPSSELVAHLSAFAEESGLSHEKNPGAGDAPGDRIFSIFDKT